MDALIGQGGMGTVYRAHDLLLDRDVAVKVLSAEKLGSQGRERLLREARAAARLNHPNIVSIYDAGKAEEGSYIVMELVEGKPLSSTSLGGISQVIHIVREICSALDHAHAHGIVHRDLKPENVIITPGGSAKLMDFGLARSAVAPRISQEDGIVGTVFYLAPEQALGGEVDGRADLYALGVMLFEQLTGRLPFDAEDPLAVITHHIHTPPGSPREYRPDLPAGLEQIILRLLEKNPADRFASAAEVSEALSAFVEAGEEIVTRLPPNNLPVMVSRFIGREREIGEVKGLLETSRLVTLTGAGGTGKTRLALQVASECMSRYPHGIWLVELAAISDIALVPQALASVFEVREQAGRSLVDSLADYLHDRQVLILLDNCEHLIDACAHIVERLLRASSKLSLLVTSREALGIAGEVAWAVPTLSAPDPAQFQALAADPAVGTDELLTRLRQYESVRLFVDRASTVQPAFQLSPANAQAIVQICHRLDGIPLAIELAAARMRALAVDQIVSRLDDRFNLLTLGSRTALPRHQTLRATLDWSNELLPESERVLFSRLSIFVDGWTLEAAEAVCSGAGIETHEVVDLLTRLVNKSLVVVQELGEVVRYRLLETIRQYARGKAQERGELEDLQARHLAFFLSLAEEAEPQLRGERQVAWLERLEAEHDNLRAALEYALGSSKNEAALRLAGNLARFWYFRGYWSEGREWLQRALAPQASRDPEAGHSMRAARARALNGAGWLADESGQEESFYSDALRLSQEVGDQWGAALSLRGLGVLAFNRNDEGRAEQLLNESLSIFRSIDDPWGIGLVFFNLGWLVLDRGDQEQAENDWKESLELFRQAGDRWGQAVVLDALSYQSRFQNDLKAAMKRSKESLRLFKELGDQAGVATSLSRLGTVALRREEFNQALALYEESLAIQREFGYNWDTANTIRLIAMIASYGGDFLRASSLLEESEARFRELESEYGLASVYMTGGLVAYLENEIDRAAEQLERARGLFDQHPDKGGFAFTILLLGLVKERQGDYPLANELLQRSQALYEDLGEKYNVAAVLSARGRVAHTLRDYPRAADLFRESLALRKDVGGKRGIAESLEDLARLAVTEGQWDRAVRLFAAAGELRAASGSPLPPVDRPAYEESLAAARERLGTEEFTAYWVEGEKMTIEEISAYALEGRIHAE